MDELARELIDQAEEAGVTLWHDDGRLRFRAPAGALGDDLRALLVEHRDAVVAALVAADAAGSLVDRPDEAHEPFPLTDIQAAYLLGRSTGFDAGGVACHAALEIDAGPLDVDRLTAAVRRVVERHPALRTRFSELGFQQVLDVDALRPVHIELVDERGVEGLRERHSHQILDAQRPPLAEFAVSRTSQGDRLHVSIDFLVADWTGIMRIIDEVVRLHADPHADLGPIGPSFRDYVVSTAADVEGAAADREFWAARLADLPEPPQAPAPVATLDGPPRFTRHSHEFTPAGTRAVLAAARRRGVTPAALVLAAYASAVGDWAAQPDFTLIVTALDRRDVHPEIHRTVGDFTTTGLVRVDDAARPLDDLARGLGAELADVVSHSRHSGVAVLRDLARERGAAAPVFPFVFTAAIDPRSLEPGAEAADWRVVDGITQTPQVAVDCQVSVLGGPPVRRLGRARRCDRWPRRAAHVRTVRTTAGPPGRRRARSRARSRAS